MAQEAKSAEIFNQRINIIVAVVVAVIAVLGSLITKLENEASTEANRASIAEQQYYYQAIGKQISGQADVNYAFGTVYQLWYQYQVQIESSQKRGEEDAIRTFTELRDAVARTSPLFDPQYFDAETGIINLPLYESNVYRRELYELEEKQLAANEVASAWDDKSSTYVLQLTLLAVAGFLLGLAVITKGKIPTLIFATSGTLMVIVISIWAYQVSLIPISERSEEAMKSFAEGASLRDQQRWAEALLKLNEAIDKAGTENLYSRAYLLRAQVHTKKGNFTEAIADYRVAIESGFVDDPTVDASLVQAYFNIGDFDSAIQVGKIAISNSPDNLVLRQQVNIAILANGYATEAIEQVDILLEQATEKVNVQRQAGDNDSVAETWWLLNDAARQYDQLAELLENKEIESPVKANIADPITVGKRAKELAAQLRNGAIALKYNLPVTSNATTELGASTSSAKININQIIPSLTPDQKYTYKVDLEFAYGGIEAGQLLSIVTYRNGIEEPSWNFSSVWTESHGEGIARYTLSPSYSSLYIVQPGLYTVSIYLNSALLAQSEFTVDDPNPEAPGGQEDDFAFGSTLDGLSLDFMFSGIAGADGGYYSYDPLLFFDGNNNYLYFLESSYNYYSNYCTDPYNLNCFTTNDTDGDGVQDENDNCLFEPGSWEFAGCPVSNDDYDGDGVPNGSDNCPSLTGPAENNGCPVETLKPDSDGDGISDYDDNCLYEPGSIENNGCPISTDDADGDGLSNDLDACPYSSGLVENNGCPTEGSNPDYDNDGIPDANDSCPYAAGPESNLGCPVPVPETPVDSDDDGILDSDDNCPYAAGPESNLGCPVSTPEVPADSDGDGILDNDDGCPYAAGPASNLGCPVSTPEPPPDSDGDGILDGDDGCPYAAGPASNLGCPEPEPDPDSDGDGISDATDNCPNEPGSIENNGCPDPVSGYRYRFPDPNRYWRTHLKFTERSESKKIDLNHRL